jgi:glycosyltransferase involved in cell wall biosynthesis
MTAPMPKVLIVAENASVRFGGEAILPFKYFQLLRRRGLDALLLTHSRNQQELATLFPNDLDRLHFIPDTRWHKLIWRVAASMPKPVQDHLFGAILNFVDSRYQNGLIRKLVANQGVEVIHQPTPVSPVAPSGVFGFGVPVVIGPMNGGMTYPPGYEDYDSAATRAFMVFGRRMGRLANRLRPGKRHAAALLVSNARTRAALPVPNHPNVIELVENGVDFATWGNLAATRVNEGRFRLVFMGRLVVEKGLNVTLHAIAIARQRGIDVTLDILGDGDKRAELEQLVDALNLRDSVRFLGFLPQSDCADLLTAGHALILNSLRECGGAVVLEAMSLGLPVIAADWGGPADYLDSSCGILVHPSPRADFDERLADAIVRLAGNPELAASMGAAGAHKVRDVYDWEKKLDRMIDIYRDATQT